MDASLFDYELPESAIAQTPAERREQSRLLVVDRASGELTHSVFADLPEFLPAGAQLFRNNASVLKARLHGKRATGGAVECLLLRPENDPSTWWCLLKPGKKLPVGSTFGLDGLYTAEVLEKREGGEVRVHFSVAAERTVFELARKIGQMPLPPYIRREKEDDRHKMDAERYQTVYAERERTVAAAAPTAGLHFSSSMIAAMQTQGFAFHDLTLHVGLGTFKPIQAERLEEHVMHKEFYEIAPDSRLALADHSRPRFAVGTTSLRATEDYSRKTGLDTGSVSTPWADEAGLFIYPPAQFHLDGLVTNFHLPRSTLLCLVSAFLTPGSTEGIRWLKEIYREAIAKNYRFYSYGDAMLIR